MSEENGVKKDYSDWVIVGATSGAQFMGKVSRYNNEEDHYVLDPAYAYVTHLQLGPQGAAQIQLLLPLQIGSGLQRVEVHACWVQHLKDADEAWLTNLLNDAKKAAESAVKSQPIGGGEPPRIVVPRRH